MPNDTAPAWDGVPLNPDVDGWVMSAENVPLPWYWRSVLNGYMRNPTMRFVDIDAENAAWLFGGVFRILTPAEVSARERAAYAAGAEAMREAGDAMADAIERLLRMGVAPAPDGASAYAAAAWRALPIPTDAAAALAEVVRGAKEEGRREMLHAMVRSGGVSWTATIKDVIDFMEQAGEHTGVEWRYSRYVIRARSGEPTP
jgi:hypothetical protein